MLIEQRKKTPKKSVSFRFDPTLLEEFKTLCKKNDLVQVQILENAMRKAINEMKEIDNDK